MEEQSLIFRKQHMWHYLILGISALLLALTGWSSEPIKMKEKINIISQEKEVIISANQDNQTKFFGELRDSKDEKGIAF